jgi:lipopolysaccharide transport system ATP-binding protein
VGILSFYIGVVRHMWALRLRAISRQNHVLVVARMEASITLDNVGVEFPIFDISQRSVKAQLLNVARSRFTLAANDALSVRALESISFRVTRGERVALIGLNGSGKTTLLQVMAGIYKPSTGVCRSTGRVASMLNIMLGMSGESTGYENIILRGTFLGWKKTELRDRAEEIAAFSELGPFLNVPIRTYSTGMRLRLAFAISTAVVPDILLMDEWIGLGDQSFSNRAEMRMMSIIARTGILVIASHDPDLLERLCQRGIVINQGGVVYDGPVDAALQYYAAELIRA